MITRCFRPPSWIWCVECSRFARLPCVSCHLSQSGQIAECTAGGVCRSLNFLAHALMLMPDVDPPLRCPTPDPLSQSESVVYMTSDACKAAQYKRIPIPNQHAILHGCINPHMHTYVLDVWLLPVFIQTLCGIYAIISEGHHRASFGLAVCAVVAN